MGGNEKSVRCFRWERARERGRQFLIAHGVSGTWLPFDFVKIEWSVWPTARGVVSVGDDCPVSRGGRGNVLQQRELGLGPGLGPPPPSHVSPGLLMFTSLGLSALPVKWA